MQVLEIKPQLANHTAFTTGYNCLHYAAGRLFLFILHVWEAMCTEFLGSRTAQVYHDGKSASHLAHHDAAVNTMGELVWMYAAKGHTAVLQAAIEAVRLGTKESIAEECDDTSMKHVRAWSKLMKDSLNQRGSRGETPVMVACEEGSAPLILEALADKLLSPTMSPIMWTCLISAMMTLLLLLLLLCMVFQVLHPVCCSNCCIQ